MCVFWQFGRFSAACARREVSGGAREVDATRLPRAPSGAVVKLAQAATKKETRKATGAAAYRRAADQLSRPEQVKVFDPKGGWRRFLLCVLRRIGSRPSRRAARLPLTRPAFS